MVREYVMNAYVPGATSLRTRERNNGQAGKELAEWHRRIERDWHAIHFGQLDVTERDGRPTISIPVYLGELDPSDVTVELYADPIADNPPERLTMQCVGAIPGAVNGGRYQADVTGSRPAADYTPRVIAHHPNARVPIEAWPIAWYR
jgi:starch phosphorylase